MTKKKITKMRKRISKNTDESKIIKKMNTKYLHIISRALLNREKYLGGVKEHLWILGLDRQEIIFSFDTLCLENLNLNNKIISKAFKSCVKNEINRAIVIHNYLNDELNVTDFDKNIADKLYQGGQIIEIEVEDYIIMNEKKFISFRYSKLMEDIKKSVAHIPSYKLKERIKEEAEKINGKAFEDGSLNARIEVAKKMMDMRIDIETVSKTTMFSVKEIKKITKKD